MSLLSWVGQEGAVWLHLFAYLTTDLEAKLQSPEYSKKDSFGWISPPPVPQSLERLPLEPKPGIGYWVNEEFPCTLVLTQTVFPVQSAVVPALSL